MNHLRKAATSAEENSLIWLSIFSTRLMKQPCSTISGSRPAETHRAGAPRRPGAEHYLRSGKLSLVWSAGFSLIRNRSLNQAYAAGETSQIAVWGHLCGLQTSKCRGE
jgi:hypothetical protein